MRFAFCICAVLMTAMLCVALPSANTIRPGQPTPAPKQEQAAGQAQPQGAPSGEKSGAGEQVANAGENQQAGPHSSPDAQAAQDGASAQEGAAPAAEAGAAPSGEAADSAQQAGPENGQSAAQAPADPGGEQTATPPSAAGAQAEEAPRPAAAAGEEAQGAAPVAEAPAHAAPENKLLSISAIGKKRGDVTGRTLAVPENARDMDFARGDWGLEYTLLDENGRPLRVDFQFDGAGRGSAVFVDEENVHFFADARAALSQGGSLIIETTEFTSRDSPRVYGAEHIECRSTREGDDCIGWDGVGFWNHVRMVESKSRLAAPTESSRNAAAAGRAPAATAGRQNSAREAASASRGSAASGQRFASSAGSRSSSRSEMGAVGKTYAELAPDGPELPPSVMERSTKAKVAQGGAALSALEGDWRFSQDLARKSDGGGVALEFHFGADGKGYSLIRDGSEKDFRAEASSAVMPDGTIRIKTDAYKNGSDRVYYPTFMECAGTQSQELSCAVSNGWMRIEDGRLVAIDSFEKKMDEMQVEELFPTTPSTPATPGTPADPAASQAGSAEMDDLFASVTPPASGQKAASASQRATSSQSSLKLPAKDSSISFMQGKWLCRTGLVRTSDNQPVVVEFAFDKNGKGTSTIREQSGNAYRSSATASYRDGILRVKTSQYLSDRGPGAYNSNDIVCRDAGGSVECAGRNGNVTWKANFQRQ